MSAMVPSLNDSKVETQSKVCKYPNEHREVVLYDHFAGDNLYIFFNFILYSVDPKIFSKNEKTALKSSS